MSMAGANDYEDNEVHRSEEDGLQEPEYTFEQDAVSSDELDSDSDDSDDESSYFTEETYEACLQELGFTPDSYYSLPLDQRLQILQQLSATNAWKELVLEKMWKAIDQPRLSVGEVGLDEAEWDYIFAD
ncbi:hypothetical protein BJ508DRAFT_336094 [Ascobolus immersus RN42]|uniref:Uncharacterized protein n=1 Tax=Ascobolus immersus RN42 TaxID=1160509 RepID=A0A3N4HEI8_ASCIM|nr:hypothetical protein BJ508DRAFT_336094 [Ascobolus immersus RN42]